MIGIDNELVVIAKSSKFLVEQAKGLRWICSRSWRQCGALRSDVTDFNAE
jgi:hypothetical protein